MNKIKKILCSVTAVIAIVTSGAAVDSALPIGNVVIAGEPLGEMKTSTKGFDLVGNAEGCRLDPYRCPAGLVTNGVGNTHDVPDQPIDLNQVAKDWVVNIQDAEQCLARIAERPMSQGQHDAFTSFVFNTGCTRFLTNRDGTSTTIARLIKQNQYQQACAQLPRWVYGGGKKLPGLVKRREAEYARCMEVD